MDRIEAEALLRRSVDDPSVQFRDGQWEAIDGLVNGNRKLLVVQRTGWGKSSVYFISARILRDRGSGPTLIVSPLLALMRNQIEAATRLGIRAVTINSSNQEEWDAVKQDILNDRVDTVLISPERLANPGFVDEILLPVANRIGLVVVDEAHCISDWGHDFRPDYRRLVNVLQQMPPNMPVLGTTATANDRVVSDILEQLGDIECIRGTLVRESLSLMNLYMPDQASRLAWLSEHIPHIPGTGIVYTLTKRDANQVTEWLNSRGIEAAAYHSGIEHPDFENTSAYRLHLEDRLLRNELKVLVATVALGMGYDKPDLAFVIHYQAPGSVVAYYQQVGRAGRAIDQAFGIMLSGREDDDIHEFFRRAAFPSEEHVGLILDVLDENDGLSVMELHRHVNLKHGQIDKVLKYLSVENPSPVLKTGSKWVRTPVEYRLDRERIERLTSQRLLEWREMQRYIGTQECLMTYLGHALDDADIEVCGKCSVCIGEPIIDSGFPRDIAIQAAHFLQHADLPLKTKIQVASGAFPEYGFRGNLPENLRAENGRILSRWGDAGWGRIVVEDKHGNHFSDDLVTAVAEMIDERWSPDPAPKWLTCVPSRNHPNLVPDFARNLSECIGLPFIEAVSKIRNNDQQKFQQNRFYQCKNLDGAFSVTHSIPEGPVFLVDDVVDSCWTLTVVAALLRNAGSGPVFPVALSTTSPGG